MILTSLLRRFFGMASRRDTVASALPPMAKPELGTIFNFFSPVHWSTSDGSAVVANARQIVERTEPGHHAADNFITWGRNNSMLDDQPFVNAWRSNIESKSDEAIIWRRYILACAAYHCIQLEGDFVECGAYTGVGMKTVMDYLGGSLFPKAFWGYDAFDRNEAALNRHMPELGKGLFERVQMKFADYPQVKLIKGTIPEAFGQGSPARIAYLHIDLNQAEAELAALDHLFDRMVPGGILILDDYEWSGMYRPQKLAEDPWFDARRYRVMPLPTGQGLVLKR